MSEKEKTQESFVPKEWNDLVDKVESEGASLTCSGINSRGPFYSSLEEQTEYLARVYKDYIPRHGVYEAIYGFGCHRSNENSVVGRLGNSDAQFILIPGRGAYILEGDIVAYSGESSWRDQLCGLSPMCFGCPDNLVLSVPATLSGGASSNTLLESLDVINFVKSRGWKSLIIVAFPVHLPRAFASIVTAARHLDWNGKIYAQCGANLRWNERVTHSHNTGAITRAEACREEQKRLDTYCVSGKPVPLLRAKELLEYLNRRDLSNQLETKAEQLGQ
jgi:hypothetical protein